MPYLTMRKNLKLQLRPGLVASYDIQPGKGVGLFLDITHIPDPHGGSALDWAQDRVSSPAKDRRSANCATQPNETVALSLSSPEMTM